jgi:hypothetical protein
VTRDPKIIGSGGDGREYDPLLTPEQVAKRLNTSLDWVRDHSSRKTPLLPVIRLGHGSGRAGMLRYRASKIEEFIEERERRTASSLQRGRARSLSNAKCLREFSGSSGFAALFAIENNAIYERIVRGDTPRPHNR